MKTQMNAKMKTMSVLLSAPFFFLTAQAQIAVPQKVKDAFVKAHPAALNAKWEKENGNFESNWKGNGQDHAELYAADGKFIQSEADIEVEKLPDGVKSYMREQVHKKIKEASENKDAAGVWTYEADVKGVAYIFDHEGKFIKTAKAD
ncbi:hypothetical protein [Arachidicoccus rhizosphaerae]|nr:hypothetical protein [Arachidicoccus rhizosphaerae]